MKKFWKWKDKADENEERVLEIDGTIAVESWFDDEITPRMFKDELYSGSGNISVWINSPGGDCIAASKIYTMLREYKGGTVTVKIDGIAASAASVIAMGGAKVLMSPTALMMIHNPSTNAYGDHREMEKTIDLLNQVKESIINAYEIKTKKSRAVLGHLMESETWMNAKKAIELGFADGMLEETRDTPNAECYQFSTREFEQKLLNKINEKVQPAPTETVKQGRKVCELRNELEKIKKFI